MKSSSILEKKPLKEKNFNWDDYFKRERVSFFQGLLALHRRIFIAPSVRVYTDKYFQKEGFYLEAGSGTSQSSSLIERSKRKLFALDLNYYVLNKHNILDHKLQGNILSLPFRSTSLNGIWNLGVMEHLKDEEIIVSLKEFSRVLDDEGVIILFWPPFFALHELLLNSISWILKNLFRKECNFFPNEINLYQNKKRLKYFLNVAGLKLERVHFSIRDIFSYMVIVARKLK